MQPISEPSQHEIGRGKKKEEDSTTEIYIPGTCLFIHWYVPISILDYTLKNTRYYNYKISLSIE